MQLQYMTIRTDNIKTDISFAKRVSMIDDEIRMKTALHFQA